MRGLRVCLVRLFPGIVYGSTLWCWHGLGDLADELLQSRRSGGTELFARNGDIDIKVGCSVCKFLGVIFAPLRRTDQSFFFGVPTADHDRSLGLPPGFNELAEPVHRFQHGGCAAVGINRSINPGVAVIACDYPFVGRCSTNLSNYIPNCAELIVLLKVHLDFCGTRTDVVSKGQSALPFAGRGWSAEVLKNRRGIGI